MKERGQSSSLLKNMSHFVPYILVLEIAKRVNLAIAKKQRGSIKHSISTFENRCPNLSDNEAIDSPIFIFSAGWRSGSTLLQRLVMSNNDVLLWGEPFKRCNLIQSLAESIRVISSEYPHQNWLFNEAETRSSGQLTDIFIANLYPELSYLKKAHQRFFLELFSKPASDKNYSRWGLKEVRLGVEYAFYLKWIFPNAKFLFLYRNPYKAYASLRPHLHSIKWDLYPTWPKNPIRTPHSYGTYWRNTVQGYIDNSHEVDGLVIKYEDLCSGTLSIDTLEEYLGIDISRDILSKKLGSTKKKKNIPWAERAILKNSLHALAKDLGYSPET